MTETIDAFQDLAAQDAAADAPATPEAAPLETQAQTPADAPAPDYVDHLEAPAMFADNPGLDSVRVKLDDGRIGDLTRAGEFRAVPVGQ